MANTLFKRGGRYTWTNNTGSQVNASSVVVLNAGATGFIGIAVDNIPNGTSGELMIGKFDEVVHTIAKKVGDVFTDALKINWDPVNLWLTTGTPTGYAQAGRSFGVFASAAATAQFMLNG